MSAPQRYRSGAYGAMVADDNGPWVQWSDVAAASPVKDEEAVAVGTPAIADMWPWAITSTGREYCFFCRAWREEKTHAHNCIWQAQQ